MEQRGKGTRREIDTFYSFFYNYLNRSHRNDIKETDSENRATEWGNKSSLFYIISSYFTKSLHQQCISNFTAPWTNVWVNARTTTMLAEVEREKRTLIAKNDEDDHESDEENDDGWLGREERVERAGTSCKQEWVNEWSGATTTLWKAGARAGDERTRDWGKKLEPLGHRARGSSSSSSLSLSPFRNPRLTLGPDSLKSTILRKKER